MSNDEQQRKLDRKRKELERRGWSEARIEAYLRHWSKFDTSTKTSRKRRGYDW